MLTGQPTVAFVIPAYNAAAVLADAVKSALGQTVAVDEVVVVDDGSADETAAVARAAGARVIQQPNAGPAAARNTGIKATSADWIALLDADDVSDPDRLERQLQFVSASRLAVVHGDCSAARLTPVARNDGSPAGQPVSSADFARFWTRNEVITSTVLLQRAAWNDVGGFNERRDLIGVEDYNLWLRLLHAGWTFVHINQSVGEYRGTPDSLTLNIPRFAAAELANARIIADECGLSPAQLTEKEFAIFRQYSLELFYKRDLLNAQAFLREALRRRPFDWQLRARLWAAMLGSRKAG